MAKKSIKGTETEKNLVIAYMAESSAYTRYNFYASQADKENYFPIGEIFRNTADNEMRHGKVFFKFLEGGVVGANMDVDAGVIGSTAENLEIAIKEEQNEGIKMYTNAAKVADKEGFPEIAEHFRAIAEIETRHKARFEAYLKQVKDGTVWNRDHKSKCKCLVCGYVFECKEPPKIRPACDHPYQHYIALDMDEL